MHPAINAQTFLDTFRNNVLLKNKKRCSSQLLGHKIQQFPSREFLSENLKSFSLSYLVFILRRVRGYFLLKRKDALRNWLKNCRLFPTRLGRALQQLE